MVTNRESLEWVLVQLYENRKLGQVRNVQPEPVLQTSIQTPYSSISARKQGVGMSPTARRNKSPMIGPGGRKSG